MKAIFKNLLFITLFSLTLATSFSQNSEKPLSLNANFVCSVGSIYEEEYPIRILEYSYDKNIKPLANGKMFPLLSKLKNDINSDKNWYLISDGDTTKLINIDLYPNSTDGAFFEVNGQNFNKKFNTENGVILYVSENKIIFSDFITKKRWFLIKQ